MGKSLSLDAIKQQFNLPQNATVAEVKMVAEANNIVIDFSKNQNNKTELNNPSGSILESTTTQTQSKQPSSTNFNLSGGSLFDTSVSKGISNENSVFGFGTTTNANLTDGLKLNRPSLENQTLSNLNNSGLTKGLTQTDTKKQKYGLNMPKLKPIAGQSLTYKLDNFLAASSTFGGNSQIKFVDDDSKDVVKLQYSQDKTQVTKTYVDGSVKTFPIPEKKQALIKKYGDISSTEFITVDGKAVARMTFADGTTKDRSVLYGEHGFVKDGSSIDEDLTSKIGEDRLKDFKLREVAAKENIAHIDEQLKNYTDEKISEIEKTDPAKAKELKKEQKRLQSEKAKIKSKIDKEQNTLTAEYIKKVYKECGGDKEKIKEKIKNLVRNSDMNTEASQQMVKILGEFHKKYGNLSEDAMAEILADAIDPSRENGMENSDAIADEVTRQNGKTGHALRHSYAQAARRTGTERFAAQALTQHIGNTVKENDQVDVESAQDTGRLITDLAGKEGALGLAEQLQKEDNDSLKVAANTPLDEYAVQTGDKEVVQASIDVITSIKDSDKQIQANENAHKTYEQMGASDEIRQARSEIMGQNLYKFNEDARTKIDTIERQYDINNTYSKAAEESKTKYESKQTKSNNVETKKETSSTNNKDNNNSSTTVTTSKKVDSATIIQKLVLNNNLNITEKTKQLKELGTKEQQAAITQLLKKATIPEVRGYILSGFKSEVFSYLLDNYTPDKKDVIESVKYLMTTSETEKYNNILKTQEEEKAQNKHLNLFKTK